MLVGRGGMRISGWVHGGGWEWVPEASGVGRVGAIVMWVGEGCNL
jgi:hypothetical protein